jgi:hypothetical protein
MASLILNGSTSGSVTLSSPAVSGTTTLTLPTTSGTVLTSASNTGFPAGSVLQVVNVTYSTETSIISTSYTNTGLSASITPTSASNKILVIVGQTIIAARASGSQIGSINLVRGATQVMEITRALGLEAGNGTGGQFVNFGTIGFSYLDSPSTTSSTTYKTQAKASSTANGGYVECQSGSSTSTLTLIEVKG